MYGKTNNLKNIPVWFGRIVALKSDSAFEWAAGLI